VINTSFLFSLPASAGLVDVPIPTPLHHPLLSRPWPTMAPQTPETLRKWVATAATRKPVEHVDLDEVEEDEQSPLDALDATIFALLLRIQKLEDPIRQARIEKREMMYQWKKIHRE